MWISHEKIWGGMNTEISLFRMKTTKTHLAGKFSFQNDFGIHKMLLKNTILSHFSPNPIRMPSRFAQNSLKFRDKCVSGSFLVHFARNTIKKPSRLGPRIHWNSGINAFWAPRWSRTSLAGPPGQPGWLALPGWPVGCLAGQAGVLAGQEWRPGGRIPPPRSYHRRWVMW